MKGQEIDEGRGHQAPITPAAPRGADGGAADAPGADGAQALLLEIHRVGTSLERLDERIDEHEPTNLDAWILTLQPEITGVADECRDLMKRIQALQEAKGGGEGRVADLVFCALVDMRVRQERFLRGTALPSGSPLIVEAGGLLQNLKRALTAIQTALCEEVGLRPSLSLTREIGRALEVRAAYAKFRRDLEAIAEKYGPGDAGAEMALCSAATSIAKLVGRDIFGKLRPQDRNQLRGLQERILAWRTAAPPPDPAEARRLWQDLYGFSQLLHLVNRRQELVEHDRKVIEEIERMVAGALSPDALRPQVLAAAARLAGRDPAFDALLTQSPGIPEVLAALRGPHFPHPGAWAV